MTRPEQHVTSLGALVKKQVLLPSPLSRAWENGIFRLQITEATSLEEERRIQVQNEPHGLGGL